ncbi:MoaD/ThiS family protein [Kribbella deserti]|uniref:MoaD/ThiS family protein n=1 Tax=Kribbella deserti TaxID=1926257 RepID=A0ABV6QX57_9ACTN
MATVTVRYFAAARAAAGEPVEQAEAASVAELVAALGKGRPDLARVLGISSFLLDGDRVEGDAALADGSVVDILPPFAGG